jgi:hypothetical protein
MAKVPNHIHKYRKVNLGGNGKKYLVYRCMKPGCSHYIPCMMAEGKLAECYRCHMPFVITRPMLYHSGGEPMAKLHCNNCTKRKKPDVVEMDIDAVADFLEGTKTTSNSDD